MKKCAFTICSQNYLGIAKTLRESFMRNNTEADFFIILVDSEDNNGVDYVLGAKEIMNVEDNTFLDMAFKYDVTEFCTAVKPYGFWYLFAERYDKVIYLDPDILVFDSLDEVWNSDASIYLTPHITEIEPKIHNEWQQEFFLKFGVFNCGFVGISNDTDGKLIVDWWKEKLKDLSFSDIDIGIFTDQKWIEFVFNFVELSKICVISNLGYDVAPWNFSERKIYKENQVYKVTDREKEVKSYNLCFVHYSTFNYKALIEKNIITSRDNIKFIPNDVREVIDYYRDCLITNQIIDALSIEYKYNRYENGVAISKFHRRLYRELKNQGKIYFNPFSTDIGTFYDLLKTNSIILKSKVNSTPSRNCDMPASFSKEEKYMQALLKIIFKILGESRYLSLLRGMRKYSRYENNLFLISKE